MGLGANVRPLAGQAKLPHSEVRLLQVALEGLYQQKIKLGKTMIKLCYHRWNTLALRVSKMVKMEW